MCDIGFYGVDGQCTKISCIENCGTCETSTICRKCNDQHYLSSDKKECTSNFINIRNYLKSLKVVKMLFLIVQFAKAKVFAKNV